MAKTGNARSHEEVQKSAGPLSQEIDKHQAATELGNSDTVDPAPPEHPKGALKTLEGENPKKPTKGQDTSS